MDAGELLSDDLIMEMVARAAGRAPTPGPGASSSTAAPGPRTRPRPSADLDDARPTSTWPSTSRSPPPRSCGAWPRAGCASTAGPTTRSSTPPKVNWTLRRLRRRGDPARGRHRGRHRPAARALRAPDRAAHRLVPDRGQLATVNGDRPPDAVLRRIIRAIEERRQTTGAGLPMRRDADELAKMRRAGKVVAEMHEATRAAARPGVTTAELDQVAREVLERRGAKSNFLDYHGLSGRDLHLAQRHDRPRHPRRLPSSRRATSSPSTAGPSSRATTATPPSPWASARSRADGRAADRGDRAEPVGRDRAAPGRGPGSTRWAGPSRPWPRRPGSPWSASTSATPSGRPCTRSPRSQLLAGQRRGPCSRRGWSSPWSPW